MKHIISSLIFIFLTAFTMAQNKYSKYWESIDSLHNIGQMQTALDEVEKVYIISKKDNNSAQTIKALLYKITLETWFKDDDNQTIVINYMNEEIEGSKPPVKQILYSALAQFYFNYYQNNSWQINGRTALANNTSPDINTWDARKFITTAMYYYNLSLTEKELLQNTSLDLYADILEKENKESRSYRPTLYDFLAFRAIDFYLNELNAVTAPMLDFKVDKEAYFAPISEFINLKIDSQYAESFHYQAVKLYQDILAFHIHDADPTALVDANLLRLAFVHKNTILQEKANTLYIEALRQAVEKFNTHPISADISYQLALALKEEGHKYNPLISDKYKWGLKEAVAVANSAIQKFEKSIGANNCRNLIENIQQKETNIVVNRAIVPNAPSLALVNYSNIDTIYFRIVRYPKRASISCLFKSRAYPVANYLSLKPIKEWSVVVTNDGDYQQYSVEVSIPALPNGFYMLLSSTTPNFKSVPTTTAVPLCSSNLSYLRKKTPKGDTEIFVADRNNGTPIANVSVQPFYQKYDYNLRENVTIKSQEYKTDEKGCVIISANKNEDNNEYYLFFSNGNDQLVSDSYYSNYYYNNESRKPKTRTYLFTDRAIYRPGQTIYFKGIAIDYLDNKNEIKANYNSTVQFFDVNHKLIHSLQVSTNDFGSFSGSFTVPIGVLTGSMLISNESGSVNVLVEEYKRPQFEIVFEPIKGTYKLGETIVAKAKASTYSGSSVTEAQVKYRVVRMARFPYYFWWWRSQYPSSPEVEIANGMATTDKNGEFEIQFLASPDLTIDPMLQPTFNYNIKVDVSDINGETHDAETFVNVGYEALLVQTNLQDNIKIENNLEFTLATLNQNNQAEKAQGSITISKLQKPEHVLFARKWGQPDRFIIERQEFKKDFPNEVYSNEDDISTWAVTKTVFTKQFSTPNDSLITVDKNLDAGMYLVEIKTKDIYGKDIVYKKYIHLFNDVSGATAAVSPIFCQLLTPTVEPGNKASLIVGTPLKNTYIIVEISSQNTATQRIIYKLNNEQQKIDIPITEEHRGNVMVEIAFIKNNRDFHVVKNIEVPFTNKKLDITIGSFRSKLEPGQKETWNITIKNKKGDKEIAELLAGMYDASLDVFKTNNWSFDIYNSFLNYQSWGSDNTFKIIYDYSEWSFEESTSIIYKEYESLMRFNFARYGRGPFMSGIRKAAELASPIVHSKKVIGEADDVTSESYMQENISETTANNNIEAVTPAIPQTVTPIKVRSNFNETAFFYPQLQTNAEGETKIQFTMPESFTRWRMLGLAHTRDLKIGSIEQSIVTQKDLMIFANAPRFLREGDKMQFSAKVTNLSEQILNGEAELHFFDALTMKPIDKLMKLSTPVKTISIEKSGNSVVTWDIEVPEGLQVVVYRITATAGIFTDGMEAPLPILTNRMLVTESLPLPINGNTAKTFTFDKLQHSTTTSNTLRNYKLTLEYTSNPAWYAVQALPYLMEYPYECAEQIFSRYYSNTLASSIINSDPKIKNIFEAWRTITPDALKSNLEKNEELKSVLLQESPWVRDANNESERKQRISLLFDLNKMALEQTKALNKLKDMQTINGGWAWFAGMPESRYITQHIVAGLGHLTQLKAINWKTESTMKQMLSKAITFIDNEIVNDFNKMKKTNKDYKTSRYINYSEIQYLYARSYFLSDFPMPKHTQEMLEYYLGQGAKYWKQNNNYMKAMIALGLNRYGDKKTSSLIMRSLSETALHSEEMGMYWRNESPGWFWYQAPIETHALIMEAFDEITGNTQVIEEMKIWLLKQKQTQDWKTTKATTEAVYALLMRGTSLLASDQLVDITVGDKQVNPYRLENTRPEPGTGYFKTSWSNTEIVPEMAKVKIVNPNNTVAWGAMYWQYYENLDKITSAQTPLKLEKKLFVETNTPTGIVLEDITPDKPIHVGDKVVVRVILSTDRDMEYIHLKDMRASSFEPLNVLSGYRWKEGLGYYETTTDAATNFFISYLPKGVYVFEYRLFATQKGEFSNGITQVQCMYAPEFTAHSEGIKVTVK